MNLTRPNRHVHFAYFLEKTSDAAKITAVDMLHVATLDLVAGMVAAVQDSAKDWDDPAQAHQHAGVIEFLRKRCFNMLPVDAEGRLALGPSDLHWYKRTAARLRKILKRQWGDNVDARELVIAAMLMCEAARSKIPAWKVDSALTWGRMCEAVQKLYEAHDPELSATEAIERGSQIGELMAKCVSK